MQASERSLRHPRRLPRSCAFTSGSEVAALILGPAPGGKAQPLWARGKVTIAFYEGLPGRVRRIPTSLAPGSASLAPAESNRGEQRPLAG